MSVPWRECESGDRRLEVTLFDFSFQALACFDGNTLPTIVTPANAECRGNVD